MKTRKLIQHLLRHGCRFDRHGGNHDIWLNADGENSAVPRHSETKPNTAAAVCRDLGIPPPPEK